MTPRTLVLYDGACPFCLKSVDLLKKLDWLGALDYADMRQDPPILSRLNVPPEQLFDQMHVLPPNGGAALHGFDAIRSLAWRLPFLWPLASFLYLPGVLSVGQRLYLWIARNRFRLIPCRHGACGIQQRNVTQDRSTIG